MYTCPRGHASQDADYCDECGTPIGATVSMRPVPAAPDGGTQVASAGAEPAVTCPQCGTAKAGRFCEVCGHDFLLARIAPPGWPRPPADGAPGAGTPAGGALPAGGPGPSGGVAAPDITLMAEGAVPGGAAVGDAADAPAGTVTAVEMRRVAPVGTGDVAPSGDAPRQWRLTATSDPAYHARMQASAEPGTNPIPFPAYCPERRFVLTGRQALIGRRSRSRGIEPEVDLTGPPADPAVSHTHALLLIQPGGGWAVVDLDSANGTYVNDDPDPIEANIPVPLADGDRIHVGAWTTLTVSAP
jgi:hypothetical protein